MRRLRSLAVLASVAALGIGVSGLTAAANAEGSGVHVNAYQQMRLDQGTACIGATDASTIGWKTVAQDSPFDTNSKALVTTVDTGGCTDAYTRSSLNINKLVGKVKNLSFDFQTNQASTGGAPRFSLIFQNGDVGFMAATRCAQPLLITGNAWSRADWTGSNQSSSAPCIFDVSGTTGGTYTSTTTESAWQVYVDAHPTQVLKEDFMVSDVPGTYTVDRVSMGTGFMFNNNLTHAVKCTTEAIC